jgi:multidrug efflux pump subunit AcrA (membrane-fusion protein)
VRAEIPNPESKLIPGSTFAISIQLPGQEAPAVPALSIQWDREGAFVWKLGEKNTVERVNAAIIARDGDRVMIDALLKPGDKVVSEGGGSLRASQTVRLPS